MSRKRLRWFLLGFGSVLDLSGLATYRAARSAGRRRRTSDWQQVGGDLRRATGDDDD